MAQKRLHKITISLDEMTMDRIKRVMITRMITSRSSALRYIVNTSFLSEERILKIINEKFNNLERITAKTIEDDFGNLFKKIEDNQNKIMQMLEAIQCEK